MNQGQGDFMVLVHLFKKKKMGTTSPAKLDFD